MRALSFSSQRSLNTVLTLFSNPSSNNLHLIHRPIFRPRLHKPHSLHNPEPTLHPPKNSMLPIQPRRWRQRDEELTPIRVLPAVRHAQDPSTCMLQCRIDLIVELFAVNGRATAPSAGGIAGLQHEVWNYAVEDDGVVVTALGEGGEVGAGSGGMVCVEFEGYGAHGGVENDVSGHCGTNGPPLLESVVVLVHLLPRGRSASRQWTCFIGDAREFLIQPYEF